MDLNIRTTAWLLANTEEILSRFKVGKISHHQTLLPEILVSQQRVLLLETLFRLCRGSRIYLLRYYKKLIKFYPTFLSSCGLVELQSLIMPSYFKQQEIIWQLNADSTSSVILIPQTNHWKKTVFSPMGSIYFLRQGSCDQDEDKCFIINPLKSPGKNAKRSQFNFKLTEEKVPIQAILAFKETFFIAYQKRDFLVLINSLNESNQVQEQFNGTLYIDKVFNISEDVALIMQSIGNFNIIELERSSKTFKYRKGQAYWTGLCQSILPLQKCHKSGGKFLIRTVYTEQVVYIDQIDASYTNITPLSSFIVENFNGKYPICIVEGKPNTIWILNHEEIQLWTIFDKGLIQPKMISRIPLAPELQPKQIFVFSYSQIHPENCYLVIRYQHQLSILNTQTKKQFIVRSLYQENESKQNFREQHWMSEVWCRVEQQKEAGKAQMAIYVQESAGYASKRLVRIAIDPKCVKKLLI
ncbi:hypothetical protein FGO68_gene4218 [Halteria grandinella]|uniref:Uncharacterized protein n=1 Tax=Halteria grandinella TaxID=5974 RepID=A0A8J8NRM4_HALGN|nr:hypothetical protein FGO68_gene4218 [Halteria grandinella]